MKWSGHAAQPRRLRCKIMSFGFAAGSLLLSTMAVVAGDDADGGTDYYAQLSCAQLWYERNAILARHGYCFRSERGVAAFGPGCKPPYGKLPANLNQVVNGIKGWEQRRGCG